MLMFVWRYLLMPVLYPIVSAPIMLPLSLAKPLQWILVLVTWGFYLIHPVAAAVFVAAAVVYYVYSFIVPPSPRSRRVYAQWVVEHEQGGELSRTVFTAGLMAGFLAGLIWLPDWNGVIRWLAAAGLAYYLSAVAMTLITALETPSLEEELQRITGDPLGPLKTPKT